MSIREELGISDEIWAAFERWAPGISADPSKDDWVRLRIAIHQFLRDCYKSLDLLGPVMEVGSWSLIPAADYSFFADKYKFYRTNVSWGNGKAPLDFLVNASNMAEIDNESLGTIIATDVIEHLEDPFMAMAEFARTLKNGGHALITVPFYFHIHEPDYIRFCPRGIEIALRRAGFDEIKATYEGDKPINIQVIARKNKKHSLLLLGGGGAVSHVEVLKQRFRVVTTDTDVAAATGHVADKLCPTASFDDPAFVDQLIRIAAEQHISAVIPAVHESVEVLMRCRSALEAAGIRVLLPPDDVTNACMDKRATSRLFQSAGLKIISEIQGAPTYPCVLKATNGAGGRGVSVCRNALDLAAAKSHAEVFQLQEFIDAPEYTIDVLCDSDGMMLLAVPRLRERVKAGEIVQGRIVKHQGILDAITALTQKHHFVGLFTVQCFDRGGELLFSEINPRFGGGFPMSCKAGAPFVDLLFDFLEDKHSAPSYEIQREASFVRAWREFPTLDKTVVLRDL